MRQALTSARAMHIVMCLVLVFSILSSFSMAASSRSLAPAAVDPDKEASELNHRIAGMFLIAIGLSVILSGRYRRLAWLRWLPPVLFIAAGLFLAAWSDNEIWPRGALSWSWLLDHDAEARQHKLYALLLVAIGLVEAMQLIPRLRRPWLKAAVPALCVLGGVSLLFHHHSSEVAMAQPEPASVHQHHHMAAGMDNPSASLAAASAATSHSHEHGLTGPAAKIQRQHAWFAVVGFWVALFKFMYDAARPPARIPRYLWANSVLLLGFLLLLYTE
jgi:uncharacterized protein YjeT (DUF2065 family)